MSEFQEALLLIISGQLMVLFLTLCYKLAQWGPERPPQQSQRNRGLDGKTFEQDLTNVINFHSEGHRLNTPDYILASYLINCLHAYEGTIVDRDIRNEDLSTTPSEIED